MKVVSHDNTSSLSGKYVVITRPSHQSQAIHTRLLELDAKPILFPCIAITELDCQSVIAEFPVDIKTVQLVIFVSSNAVRFGLPHLARLLETTSHSACIAAIGASTAQDLRQAGIQSVLVPKQGFDSEALLQLPELQSVQEQNILIVKGKGGRTLLNNTLTNRRANVYSLDVYQRDLPKQSAIGELQSPIDVILFTSSESVENFLKLAPHSIHNELMECQTLVGHQRIATKVTSLGFKKLPIIATNPSDTAMLEALQNWATNGEQ